VDVDCKIGAEFQEELREEVFDRNSRSMSQGPVSGQKKEQVIAQLRKCVNASGEGGSRVRGFVSLQADSNRRLATLLSTEPTYLALFAFLPAAATH
jgi:hypothetical protein